MSRRPTGLLPSERRSRVISALRSETHVRDTAVASGADLPTLSALLGHATIQMTMRYVHPAAEQKRVAIEKFERFRTEGIINAAAAQESQRVPTKVTTVPRVN